MYYHCFAPGGAIALDVNCKSPALSCPVLRPGPIKYPPVTSLCLLYPFLTQCTPPCFYLLVSLCYSLVTKIYSFQTSVLILIH